MSHPATWQDANTTFLQWLVTSLRSHLATLADAGKSAFTLHWPHLVADQPPPALLLLRDAFDLSAFETAVLALCAAHELDTGIGPLCARLADDPSRPFPQFGVALLAFAPGAWEAVSVEGKLRKHQLITLERRPGEPLALAALRCDERILDFIKGLNRLDERLGGRLADPPAPDAPADADAVATLARVWREPDRRGAVALLFGADAAARRSVAAAAAAIRGLRLCRLEADLLPPGMGEIDQVARLWNREAVLLPLALLIEAEEASASGAALHRFMDGLALPAALSSDRPASRGAEAMLTIAVARPGADRQEAAWTAGLGVDRAALAQRLAGAFDFNLERIARLAAGRLNDAEVWQHCVASVRPLLDTLAHRIVPRAGWDDLVLPAEPTAMLRQIVDQVQHRREVYQNWGYAQLLSRGLGITALFAGDSGTGKTMAAEVLATELGLNLYRIDLSAVVSKYIGESSKNLRQLFDAAEAGGAVLLFDEADALFGKRSEVKDSHDRYANIEVNYLLQRIESFSGLAILATNLKAALDAAFLRRLRFVVRFPHPGPAERALMWQRAFPPLVPRAALDHERLARINLTGGHIIAAALNAAFLAAAEDRPVAMHHVLQAARAELVKLNRPINEADFADRPAAMPARAAE